MRQLSLHILDIVCNSIDFGASFIEINILFKDETVKLEISDNGMGMDGYTLKNCINPNFSTRNSKGMGLSLLKKDCEECGGELQVFSQPSKGTRVEAVFKGIGKNINALGDIGATVAPLLDDKFDLLLNADIYGKEYSFDTRVLKEAMDGRSIQSPSIIVAVKNHINEKFKEIGGAKL